jgi:hypothetical protein
MSIALRGHYTAKKWSTGGDVRAPTRSFGKAHHESVRGANRGPWGTDRPSSIRFFGAKRRDDKRMTPRLSVLYSPAFHFLPRISCRLLPESKCNGFVACALWRLGRHGKYFQIDLENLSCLN